MYSAIAQEKLKLALGPELLKKIIDIFGFIRYQDDIEEDALAALLKNIPEDGNYYELDEILQSASDILPGMITEIRDSITNPDIIMHIEEYYIRVGLIAGPSRFCHEQMLQDAFSSMGDVYLQIQDDLMYSQFV